VKPSQGKQEEKQERKRRKKQRGKREMGQIAKPKTVGGTMAQTPRKKDCRREQRRLKKAKQVGTHPRQPHHRSRRRHPQPSKPNQRKLVLQEVSRLFLQEDRELFLQEARKRPPSTSKRVPTKFPGILTSIPSMNTHFFQGSGTI